jgi:hypothetical protein
MAGDPLPNTTIRDLRDRVDLRTADWHSPTLEDDLAIVRALDELIERRIAGLNDVMGYATKAETPIVKAAP